MLLDPALVMELFQLTTSMVNIDSVTGNERACGEFLSAYLDRKRFHVELQEVTPGRANILAVRGSPRVVLSTHMDTVPPFIPAREDTDFIYGRGSCDAKGIIACQIMAAQRLAAEGISDFGLLFVVGEEVSSDGAQAANGWSRGTQYIINGEPTENKLAIGSKGILRVDIRTHGRMAHSAYPHLGENAIDKMIDILADIRALRLPSDPVLGPSTLNIGLISGGRAANVVPDQAEAQVLIRTVTPNDELRSTVARVLNGRCEYDFARSTPALRMEKIEGFETEVVAFTTDLPSLGSWGRPILLGPGSISVAHTENECVRKADLVEAVELYCRLVRDLKRRYM